MKIRGSSVSLGNQELEKRKVVFEGLDITGLSEQEIDGAIEQHIKRTFVRLICRHPKSPFDDAYKDHTFDQLPVDMLNAEQETAMRKVLVEILTNSILRGLLDDGKISYDVKSGKYVPAKGTGDEDDEDGNKERGVC